MTAAAGTARIAGSACLLVLATALVACGGTSSDSDAATASSCADVKALQTTAHDLQKMDVDQTSLGDVTDQLTTLRTQLADLGDGASAAYTTQKAVVRTKVGALRASVVTAGGDPSATTLTAVGTAAGEVRTSVDDLRTSVSDSC